jgi:hypothetical protein
MKAELSPARELANIRYSEPPPLEILGPIKYFHTADWGSRKELK